jgi:hypothetical protein
MNIACNMNALTRAERDRHHALLGKLAKAVVGRQALPNGYTFRISPERLPLTELAEWVGYESRCCPFLGFGIELESKETAVTLRLTGGMGTKEFLEEELGLK